MQRIRAALAAMTPFSESSSTTHASGGDVEARCRLQENARMRLAVRFLLGRLDDGERVGETEALEGGGDDPRRRRRGEREPCVARARQRDGVRYAFERGAFGRDQSGDAGRDETRLHLGERHSDEAARSVPMKDDVVRAEPLGLGAFVGDEHDAGGRKNLHFGADPERLRVDEEPIHVEDHRALTPRHSLVTRGCHARADASTREWRAHSR